MRLASLQPQGLALVRDDPHVPISDALAGEAGLTAGATMIDLITNFDRVRGRIESAAAKGKSIAPDPKQLAAPVLTPTKIWAAAGNYRRGGTGLDNAAGRGQAS